MTSADELREMQRLVPGVRVDDAVRGYIVSVTRQTREHDSLSLGASPRAGLALYKASQAAAAMDGRDFVTPDDVKAVAVRVLSHRLVLTSNARLRGRTTAQIVEQVLSSTPVPIER